jgi:hypothetical protein
MKLLRVLLFLPGLAALVWGAVLFGQFALPLGPQSVPGFGWLLGGPLVHDGLVAPVAGLLGLLLTRIVPPKWRGPVVAGTVASGVLAILSVPLLWRPFGGPVNPGLHDGDTATGLLITLAALWTLVILGGVVRIRLTR